MFAWPDPFSEKLRNNEVVVSAVEEKRVGESHGEETKT